MSATTYKFIETEKPDFKFPEFLFIDTSFLLNVFIPVAEKIPTDLTVNNNCCKFLNIIQKKAKAGELCLFTDNYVLNEFFFFIIKNKIESVDFKISPYDTHVREYDRKGQNPLGCLLKDHPELLGKYFNLLKYYYEAILEIPIAILTPELLISRGDVDISQHMCDLIEQFQILPADALHIALGKRAGINDFVAIDTDFHKVDKIAVYTCLVNKSKCKICPS